MGDLLRGILLLVFLALNQADNALADQYSGELWYKLLRVSFLPLIYMLIAGILVQRNVKLFHRMFSGEFLAAASIYLPIAILAMTTLDWEFGNSLHPIPLAVPCMFVYSTAFSRGQLGDRVLERNAILCRVYIYHMPLINLLLATQVGESKFAIAVALSIAICFAIASWWDEEEPMLKHNAGSPRAVQSGAQ